VVDTSYRMSIANVNDRKEYQEILDDIIGLAHYEVNIISNGGTSCWNVDLLEKCVIPEMVELQKHVLRGELYLKFGKQQRLLESAYILTDSLNTLTNTPLGIQISILQQKMYTQKEHKG